MTIKKITKNKQIDIKIYLCIKIKEEIIYCILHIPLVFNNLVHTNIQIEFSEEAFKNFLSNLLVLINLLLGQTHILHLLFALFVDFNQTLGSFFGLFPVDELDQVKLDNRNLGLLAGVLVLALFLQPGIIPHVVIMHSHITKVSLVRFSLLDMLIIPRIATQKRRLPEKIKNPWIIPPRSPENIPFSLHYYQLQHTKQILLNFNPSTFPAFPFESFLMPSRI